MNNLENPLYSKIATLLELARKQVATTVNLTMVHTYFEIGRTIVEDEQQGESRAEYGKHFIDSVEKISNNKRKRTVWFEPEKLLSRLSFSHFVELLNAETALKRSFYEFQTIKNNWSARELSRAMNRLLFKIEAKAIRKPVKEKLCKKMNILKTIFLVVH